MTRELDGGPPSYTCANCGTRWDEVQLICPNCGAPWASSRPAQRGLTQGFKVLAGFALVLIAFTTAVLGCIFALLLVEIMEHPSVVDTFSSGLSPVSIKETMETFQGLTAMCFGLSFGSGWLIYRLRRWRS